MLRNCQMVTSTISGTCHHEVKLSRVDSLYSTFFKYAFTTMIQIRQFRSKNIEFQGHILWLDAHTLIFRQNISDGYMSRQRHI